MKIFSREVKVSTTGRRELLDITSEAKASVAASGVTNGLCVIFSRHTTATVIVNENESGLRQDIMKKVEDSFPESGNWKHNRIDNNADAHLACTFFGPSVSIPVVGGSLTLGTWQSIFLLELDGPRSRSALIEVIGE